MIYFFFSSRRRHTRYIGDWSSDVCSSDLWYLRMPRVARVSGSDVRSPSVSRDSLVGYQEVGGAARPAGTRMASSPANAPEIGRASCRERVYISVGARWGESK